MSRKVGETEMSDDEFVSYDEFPKPHTGSFLTAKQAESFKDVFKDLVRVVRCKDCNKRGTSECYVENASGELAFPWIPPDDWFCADGKRTDT